MQLVPASLLTLVGVMTPDGVLVQINPAALEAISLKPNDVLGKPFENTHWWAYDSEIQEQLRAAISTAAQGRQTRYDTVVRSGKGLIPLDLTILPVFDAAGNVTHVIASGVGVVRSAASQSFTAGMAVRDITERKRGVSRIERLQRVTAALSKSVTPHEVAQVIMQESMGALDAVAGAIHILTEDGNGLELLDSIGYSATAVERYGRLPLAAPVLGAEVARTGRPVWFENGADLNARYPFLPDGVELGQRGGAIVPLIAEDRMIGVMVLIFGETHTLDAPDRDFVLAIAGECAQALERARIFEHEQVAREAADSAARTAAFLAEVSRSLSVSLDVDSQLRRINQLAVPFIADMSVVILFELDGAVSVVKAAHVQPEKAGTIEAWASHFQRISTTSPSPMLQVLQTGKPVYVPDLSDEKIDALAGTDAEMRRFWQESGVKSLIIVPLSVYGRVFGAVVLAMGSSGRRYSQEDLALAEEWAHRVALPVDNARLHQALQALNAELEQRVVQRTIELNVSRNQLRNLAARLQAAREEERKRMAREVHDVIGQLLTGLKMDVSSLGQQLTAENSPSISRINDINSLLDNTIKSVRKVATELRPSILDDMGLVAAMEWQVREFAERSGIACDFTCSSDEIPMDNEKATAIFRLIQEAITNVARHAQATEMQVEMREDNGILYVEVRDNGRGITDQELYGATSLGLLGMRERVHLLSGQLEIRGMPGHGTTVTAQIPLAKTLP